MKKDPDSKTLRVHYGASIRNNKVMKKDIHPKYYSDAVAKCACGNTFKVGSTSPEIFVEICSACHPFYTGKEKLVDTAGRVERFKKMVAKGAQLKKGKKK